jgi:hypothetical protein
MAERNLVLLFGVLAVFVIATQIEGFGGNDNLGSSCYDTKKECKENRETLLSQRSQFTATSCTKS